MAAKPLCPHCDAPLPKDLVTEWAGGFYSGPVTLIACPACRRVLGILPRPATR